MFELTQNCDQAQDDILELVQKNKRDFDQRVGNLPFKTQVKNVQDHSIPAQSLVQGIKETKYILVHNVGTYSSH